jgi:flagellar basal body-associated protein FliL
LNKKISLILIIIIIIIIITTTTTITAVAVEVKLHTFLTSALEVSGEKNPCPYQESNPGHPVRSQSLH